MKKPKTKSLESQLELSNHYRIIGGIEYSAWKHEFNDPEVPKAYRKAGIECKQIGDILFVATDDLMAAVDVDLENNFPA